MKKLSILYWISTGLFALFIGSGAVQNVLMTQQSIDLITTKLGYPLYIIPFLGIAKLLGVAALLIPVPSRLREWAYAGIFFDMVGAMYSGIATEGFNPLMLTMIVPFALMGLSYGAHHRILQLKTGDPAA